MSNTTVYECPECGDRKMADYKQQLPPTLWCSCDGFAVMDVVEQ